MNAEKKWAIEAKGLGFRIRSRKLLHSMSFELVQGKTLGVVGHNGAGKTTLFHVLLGLKFPSSGEVRLFGRSNLIPESRAGLGYVPERPYLNLDLTFEGFLQFHSGLIGMEKSEVRREVERVAVEVGLSANLKQRFKTFSKGMLQKAVLAQASLGNPALLVLDEPLSGLDPESREAVKARMRAWKSEGRTLVFSSHALEDVDSLAEEVMVLKGGVLQFFGEVSQWREKR
jgi:ABC-type multidrug transport system ATPase subunit